MVALILKFEHFLFREVNETPYNRNDRSSPASKILDFEVL